jgi:hypothetical protein
MKKELTVDVRMAVNGSSLPVLPWTLSRKVSTDHAEAAVNYRIYIGTPRHL